MYCKNGKIVLTQFGYLSFLLHVCIVKHSGVPLRALDFTQIKNLIWLFRTPLNVMDECFVIETAQSCGNRYETKVTKEIYIFGYWSVTTAWHHSSTQAVY